MALGEEAAKVGIEGVGGRQGDGGEAVNERLRGETGDGEAGHRGRMGRAYILKNARL